MIDLLRTVFHDRPRILPGPFPDDRPRDRPSPSPRAPRDPPVRLCPPQLREPRRRGNKFLLSPLVKLRKSCYFVRDFILARLRTSRP
jgi:hypothetical protein